MTSANSGSGTDQRLSRRTRTGSPGPETRWRRLEEQLGPVGGVDLVVMRRARLRLFHAGDLAALVGDAGGPDFLPVDRGQESNRVGGDRSGVGIDQKPGETRRIGGVQDVGQRAAVLDLREVEQQNVLFSIGRRGVRRRPSYLASLMTIPSRNPLEVPFSELSAVVPANFSSARAFAEVRPAMVPQIRAVVHLPGGSNSIFRACSACRAMSTSLRCGDAVVVAFVGRNVFERQFVVAAVDPVGDDRMPEVLHVDAQLVRAAGLRQQRQRRKTPETFEHLVTGDGLARVLARFADDHLLATYGCTRRCVSM